MRIIWILLIKVYQWLFSFDHGLPALIFKRQRVCLFYPSCSEYTRQSILKYGLIIGSYKGFRRILKCGPWSLDKHKWDPVK